jgi:hypothetical protein
LPEISQIKLGELIELAIEEELIQFCYIARKVVIISLGRHQLSFPPDEARTFLRALVQGWSRARLPGEAEPRAHGPREAEPGPPPAPAPTSPLQPTPEIPREESTSQQPPTSEEYIELILSFSQRLGIIKDYYKDPYTRKVTLQTRDTTTDMSYFDTLEYLMDSILDMLRADLQS